MAKIKNIIFDLDGTILNTDLYVVMNYVHMFELFRKDYMPSLQELVGFSGPPLVDIFKKYFPKYPLDVLLDEFKAYQKLYSKKYSKLYEHEIEILDTFLNLGYQMAIVTSKKRYATEANLEDFSLNKYFKVVVTLDDVCDPKPNPEGINKAIGLLNGNKEDSVYVGDNISDILAGERANVKTILVDFGLRDNHFACEKKCKMVNSFLQLLEVIKDE